MKHLFLALLVSLFLYSCQIKNEFQLKSDGSGSFKMNVQFSQTMIGKSERKPKFDSIPKNQWVNMYDFMSYKKDSSFLRMSEDSIAFMKRFFIKMDVNKDTILTGISLKVDKIKAGEWDTYWKTFNKLGESQAKNPMLTSDSEGVSFKWDGKTLEFHTLDKLFGEDDKKSKKDNLNKASADMIKSMFGEEKIVIIYRFSFQGTIAKIKGKNDCIQKVNDHTIEYRVDMLELMDQKHNGKKIKHKDDTIVITTL